VAQLAHLVHVGHIGLREQPLDQRLEQRQAVAQALDAAVEALLARLRREAFDVVHEAVSAGVLVGLFPAQRSVGTRAASWNTDLHFCLRDLHLSQLVSVRFRLSRGTLREALVAAPVGVVADADGAVMVMSDRQERSARHVAVRGRWGWAGGRHQHSKADMARTAGRRWHRAGRPERAGLDY
jgi:hypothetical protein